MLISCHRHDDLQGGNVFFNRELTKAVLVDWGNSEDKHVVCQQVYNILDIHFRLLRIPNSSRGLAIRIFTRKCWMRLKPGFMQNTQPCALESVKRWQEESEGILRFLHHHCLHCLHYHHHYHHRRQDSHHLLKRLNMMFSSRI